MKKDTKILLKLLGWLLSTSIYLFASFYIIFKLNTEESLLFLSLLLWMTISGAGLLYTLYKIIINDNVFCVKAEMGREDGK